MTIEQKQPSKPRLGCLYLTSLSLKNVRTFRSDTRLSFCHPNGKVAQWTVLLGENGTGKTTLLQHIAALQPVQALMHTDPKTKVPISQPMGAGQSFFAWHIHNIPRPWGRPAVVEVDLQLSDTQTNLADAKALKQIPYGYTLTFGEKDGVAAIKSESKGRSEVGFMKDFFVIGFGANRHVAGPSSPYLSRPDFANQASKTGSLFSEDLPLISPNQWLLGLDHISKTEGRGQNAAKRSLDQAKACLVSVLPDVTAVSVSPFAFQSGQAQISVLFDTAYGQVLFDSLSIGYKTMAAWLIDFLRSMHERYPDLEAPEKGPAVVLIDEFDLHMHPKWQTTVMDYLSDLFPNTQFVITTHSPLIVQAAGERANIALLRRVPRADGKGEEIVIDNDPVHVRGWRVDQLLTSDLYGLDSTRSPKYQKLFARRLELAQKDTLSETDQTEFDSISKALAEEAPPQAKGYSNGSRSSKKRLRKANGAP